MSERDPQCPVCHVPLEPFIHEMTMIWGCLTCHGTFMPLAQLYAIVTNEAQPRSRDELFEAVDRASEKLPLLDNLRPKFACPSCAEEMERSVFDGNSGIGIDTCATCGVWLDRGELERAEAWREAQRAGLLDGASS